MSTFWLNQGSGRLLWCGSLSQVSQTSWRVNVILIASICCRRVKLWSKGLYQISGIMRHPKIYLQIRFTDMNTPPRMSKTRKAKSWQPVRSSGRKPNWWKFLLWHCRMPTVPFTVTILCEEKCGEDRMSIQTGLPSLWSEEGFWTPQAFFP